MTNKLKTTSKPTKTRRPKQKRSAKDILDDPFFFFKFKDVSNKLVDDVAYILIEWMNENKNNTVLAKFFAEYNIPSPRFYEWIKQPRGSKLRHAFNLYKQRLSVTREQGVNLNQLNFNAIKFNQHQYSTQWKEATEYHNELKQQVAEKESSGKQIVLMNNYKIDEKDDK